MFCAVKIDARALARQVNDLTQRYDTLMLKDVEKVFDSLHAIHGNAISWLFSLRNSALFLVRLVLLLPVILCLFARFCFVAVSAGICPFCFP